MFSQNERDEANASNRRTHLSESEVLEILELARKTAARDWAILCITFNHGLRVSECCALTLASINWKDRTITVPRLKRSLTTTQVLTDLRGKPALNEVQALRAYLKARIDDGSNRLFTGQKGTLTRWTLTRMFREYCERVSDARVTRGLAPIAENARHFHVLRHSIATLLANRVDNIFHVKTWLGHASISSSMIYCAPDQKLAAAKAHEVLARAFTGIPTPH